MIENAVKDDAHPRRVSSLKESGKRRVAAEAWIDVQIVRRIVFMVGGGGKDRRKIYHRNTERGKIGQLFTHAPKIAAEKHIVFHRVARTHGILRHAARPVVVNDRIVAVPCLSLAAKKAIDKNMVHYPAAEPVGRAVIIRIHKKAEPAAALAHERKVNIVPCVGEQRVHSARDDELIKIQTRLFPHEIAGRDIKRVYIGQRVAARISKREIGALAAAVGKNAQHHRSRPGAARQDGSESHALVAAQRTDIRTFPPLRRAAGKSHTRRRKGGMKFWKHYASFFQITCLSLCRQGCGCAIYGRHIPLPRGRRQSDRPLRY